jgi:hypothetical protein
MPIYLLLPAPVPYKPLLNPPAPLLLCSFPAVAPRALPAASFDWGLYDSWTADADAAGGAARFCCCEAPLSCGICAMQQVLATSTTLPNASAVATGRRRVGIAAQALIAEQEGGGR